MAFALGRLRTSVLIILVPVILILAGGRRNLRAIISAPPTASPTVSTGFAGMRPVWPLVLGLLFTSSSGTVRRLRFAG